MTESRPIQPPPLPPGQTRPAPPPEEPNAQITALPPGLDEITEMLKIRGEVFQVRADNIVRIMTDQGEIDIRLEPGQPLPAKGDTVELEIQPGRPPTAVHITVEEELPAPPPRSVQTPVEVTVREREETPLPPQAGKTLPDVPVRLEPLPPEEALALIADPLEVILSTVEELANFKTEIIVEQIRQDIAEQITAVLPASEKAAPTFPPLAQITGLRKQPPPLIFTDIKPAILSLPEPAVLFVNPQALVPANVQIVPETQAVLNTPSSLPFVSTENVGPLEPFQIQISLDDISKPVALPQMFHARIAATQIPPAQIFEPLGERIIPKLKTILSAASEPLILQNQKAGTIIATVVAQTPQKLPVVAFFSPQAPGAPEKVSFFILHIPAPSLTPGTELVLAPQDQGAAHITLAAPVSMPLAFPVPEPWPLMDEILEALAQVMPQAAQAFSNTLPSPARPEQLGPAAMFFIAAVRGGDLTGWLGERAADVMRRAGRAGLISRLGNEGAALNRLSSEPAAQDWRALSLPLFWDNEVHKLALYFREDKQGGKEGQESGKQVRFIFDLNLNQMGKVQLDGLFRAKRLDLIVRSESAFSSAMQMQMRRAYISALEPTEVRGELSFQNKPEQWVTIKAGRQKFGMSA